MDIESIKAARGLYRIGLMSREDFLAWADDKILNGNVVDSNLFESLMYISLMGKKHANDFKYVHDDFCLEEEFAVRVCALDCGNVAELESFNKWVRINASSFSDFSKKIARYGYSLMYADEMGFTEESFLEAIVDFKESFKEQSNEIWSRIT